MQKQGYSPEDAAAHNLAGLSLTIKDYKATAEELGIGEITLRDIVKELEKPARDPRDEMPKPILRTDVLEMKDLKEGMILKRNRPKRNRLWSICRHRSPPGRTCTHIPDDKQKIHQTSTRSRQRRRHRRRQSHERRLKEKKNTTHHERCVSI